MIDNDNPFDQVLGEMQGALDIADAMGTEHLTTLNQDWMQFVREISEKRTRLVGLIKDRQVETFKASGDYFWAREGWGTAHACSIEGSNAQSICGTILTHAQNVQPPTMSHDGQRILSTCLRCETAIAKRGLTVQVPESVWPERVH